MIKYSVHSSTVICPGGAIDGLDAFMEEMRDKSFKDSGVYKGIKSDTNIDKGFRNSQQLQIDPSHPFIFNLAYKIFYINSKVFKINVQKYCCENTIVKYRPGGFFKEHKDLLWPSTNNHTEFSIRKLTALVMMSSSSDFKGGQLRIRGEENKLFRPVFERGDMVIFPSYVNHSVDVLTEGERYSLVMWSHGNF